VTEGEYQAERPMPVTASSSTSASVTAPNERAHRAPPGMGDSALALSADKSPERSSTKLKTFLSMPVS